MPEPVEHRSSWSIARVRSQFVSTLRERALIGGIVSLLLASTIWAFVAFDAGSHSASDTLRPLVITMVPLWLAGIALVRLLVTSKRGRRPE